MGKGRREEEGEMRGGDTRGGERRREGGSSSLVQCRINHVADVANATGLGPLGASGSRDNFFSPSVVKYII